MARLVSILLLGLLMVPTAYGGEIGFAEEFALAKDRTEALKKLIPGTEDYYYFHCLHYLNTMQFDKAVEMTKPWYQRFNQTGRLTEIQTRHAILSYEKNPQESLNYIRDHLGLSFEHQRVVQGGVVNLPTRLDSNMISRETLAKHSWARWTQGSDNYEDSALDWVLNEKTDSGLRRHLLSRLTRPDIENLTKMISDDLKIIHSGGFGSFNIHRQLTQKQLDELVKLIPDLINNSNYAQAYISKLQPGEDEDWRRDPALTKAYLDRLLTFVRKLPPAFNPLKVHVIFHRLTLDETQGKMDKELFVEYLKLPRNQGYMSKSMLDSRVAREFPASLGANYTPWTLLTVVSADEPLVRSYLKHFLVEAKNATEFEPYINDTYLRHLHAETQIENGIGEPETWAANLPPELFRQLKDRIDIDFAPTNLTTFGVDDPVKLELFIKNVPSLRVKVFEINSQNFYRTQQREVDTAVNLDGLVANNEKTHTFTESPFRRVGKTFEFPQINKPGIYVIDFIGAGKSSRALVRKGRMRTLQALGTAGHKLTVIDDSNKPVPGTTVWLGGQEYTADANGNVVLPYSTNPGRRPIVLTKGEFSSLDFLNHQSENYALLAGIHIDRESLLTQRVSNIVVRPSLRVNGLPVSVKALSEVRLVINATDQDGISSSTEVPDFKLFEDRESVHEFRVPPRLTLLRVALVGKVKVLSTGQEIMLAAGDNFGVNGINKTDKIEDMHFGQFGNDFVIELLGRTGEPKADRPVSISIKHREFKEQVGVTLKSDVDGRIHLGPLTDIAFITASGPEGISHTWNIPQNRHTFRQVIHSQQGEPINVPYLGSSAKPSRTELALFEVRGSTFVSDRFDSISINEGTLQISGLPAGDYDLFLKEANTKVRLRVVAGTVQSGYVLGKLRHLQLPALKPVQFASVTSDNETVTIKLRDYSEFTRVHIYATRYMPAFDGFSNLARIRDTELAGMFPLNAESIYLAGRNIGDEYRYVLDRQNQKKFPGNMLDRPALLLNPWVIRSTETGEQLAIGGEDYRKMIRESGGNAIHEPKADSSTGASNGWGGGVPGGDFASLDFLYDGSPTILNLVPDKDGVIKLNKKQFGNRSMVHLLAIDPMNTTSRSLNLKEGKAEFVDLRLRNGLDPKRHFTQQKQVSVLKAGQSFVIEDAIASRFEMYDSLSKVYTLYSTLSHDPKLAEFSFILNWPKMKLEEKKTYYSKFACHELSFFIMKKDPEFFNTVVQPYLVNKKDKTFVDHYLLGDDLKEFAQPWHHERLNSAEKVLLSQRMNDSVYTSRHIVDILRLQPRNLERERLLFDSALKANDLSMANDATKDLPRKAEQMKRLEEMRIPLSTSSPAAPPRLTQGEMGGFAGGMGGPSGMPKPTGEAREQLEKQMDRQEKAQKEMKAESESLTRDGRSGGKMKGEGKKGEPSPDGGEGTGGRPGDTELSFFENDRSGNAPARLYRKVDPTMELAENNYYKLPIQQQIGSLIGVSEFWADYAKHDGKGPFLSSNLAEASRNFSEMMLALSVLDLPFKAEKHDVKFENGKMTIVPGSLALAFHEEVKPVGDAAKNVQILVSQNFYRHGDRYRDENGERFDKFITDEFVIHTVYGCQVVVTNPSPSRQRLTILTQIPNGALPVSNGQATKTHLIDLEPYRTQLIDFQFYFPAPGDFAQFPVHVAKSEVFVAAASPFTFKVVPKPTKLDTQSWEYVSQNGSEEEVIAFLNRENVMALDLGMIAFRMKDKKFFEKALTLLQQRHTYHPVLWSYGIHHANTAVAKEFLTHNDQTINECAGPISSPLLAIDPVIRHQYEHLEYKPLINARAHSLGKDRQIVNNRFFEQYQHLLKVLSYRPKLTDDDQMAICYYMLLQDRVDEALTAWKQVRSEGVSTRIQYDYCAAYLEMFQDERKKARSIVAQYENHPVDRWRNAFVSIGKQLDEIEGKGPKLVDQDDQAQQQALLAAKEPTFEFTVAQKNINLTWKNIETVKINYYLMDVELLFSRNPFVQQNNSQFAMIRPNQTQEVKLPKFGDKFQIPLPENLTEKNVLVEIVANGKTRSVPVLANVMSVTMNENYGQLQVTDATSGKSLSKVYIKTYVRLADGTVKFHKDGYTDLRGKFDYASVSTPERSPIAKFGILVLSDTQGAIIREVNPPQQ
jgi:hypothetical protein